MPPGRSIERMQVSPFYNLNAKFARAGLCPPKLLSAARIAKVSFPRTVVHAALHVKRFGRRHMVRLGGLAEVETFDSPFSRRSLRRPLSIPPLIERDDNWT
jgi:hypothetical protein